MEGSKGLHYATPSTAIGVAPWCPQRHKLRRVEGLHLATPNHQTNRPMLSSTARFTARYVVQTQTEFLGETSWVNDSWWNDAEDAAQYVSMRRTFSDPKDRHLGWRIAAN